VRHVELINERDGDALEIGHLVAHRAASVQDED